jgi:hypothetical protein
MEGLAVIREAARERVTRLVEAITDRTSQPRLDRTDWIDLAADCRELEALSRAMIETGTAIEVAELRAEVASLREAIETNARGG